MKDAASVRSVFLSRVLRPVLAERNVSPRELVPSCN
jgi:hypothetical protein